MKSKKRDNPLFYADPDDPLLYLYKIPRVKWIGVTLNFAHPLAWRTFGIIMGACLLPVIPVLGTKGALWSIAALLAVLTAVVIHCFRAAERELRQYGEWRDTK